MQASLDIRQRGVSPTGRVQSRNLIHREDNDFAMSYIKRYGRGRVFYCGLGHMHDLFWNPTVLQHWLDGIQYVLGDLEADATTNRPEPKNHRKARQS